MSISRNHTKLTIWLALPITKNLIILIKVVISHVMSCDSTSPTRRSGASVQPSPQITFVWDCQARFIALA